jgi:predicted RNase H-like nuclease (RuvC/YqgF family)
VVPLCLQDSATPLAAAQLSLHSVAGQPPPAAVRQDQQEATKKGVAELQMSLAASEKQREGARQEVAQLQASLATTERQREEARKEVAQLQARLDATERQREEACRRLAAERAQAAAVQAEDQRIASSHQELQAAWKGMVDELKEQLKVRCGHACLKLQTQNCTRLCAMITCYLIQFGGSSWYDVLYQLKLLYLIGW